MIRVLDCGGNLRPSKLRTERPEPRSYVLWLNLVLTTTAPGGTWYRNGQISQWIWRVSGQHTINPAVRAPHDACHTLFLLEFWFISCVWFFQDKKIKRTITSSVLRSVQEQFGHKHTDTWRSMFVRVLAWLLCECNTDSLQSNFHSVFCW